MTDDELTDIFRKIRKGQAPEGWGGEEHEDIDTITDGDRVWERHKDPDGPWRPVPGMAGND